MFRPKYSASGPPASRVPVTVETNGTTGSDARTRPSCATNSSLQRRHLRAVEGVVDRQHAATDATPLQFCENLVEGRGFSRQNHAARPVDRADTETRAIRRDDLGGFRLVETDRGHPAVTGRPLHDPPAVEYDPDRLREIESAGDMQRSDLPDTMADDAIRETRPTTSTTPRARPG